jgi:hypothetical protein
MHKIELLYLSTIDSLLSSNSKNESKDGGKETQDIHFEDQTFCSPDSQWSEPDDITLLYLGSALVGRR